MTRSLTPLLPDWKGSMARSLTLLLLGLSYPEEMHPETLTQISPFFLQLPFISGYFTSATRKVTTLSTHLSSMVHVHTTQAECIHNTLPTHVCTYTPSVHTMLPLHTAHLPHASSTPPSVDEELLTTSTLL